MTTRQLDVHWLDGFLKTLWPTAAELIGAEFTHAAIMGFNHPDPPPPGWPVEDLTPPDGPPGGEHQRCSERTGNQRTQVSSTCCAVGIRWCASFDCSGGA